MSITTTFRACRASLTSLSDSVQEDGDVDSDEVEALRTEIYSDGSVDAQEVAVLFDIADNCSYDSYYENLVSQAVRDWAYADGEIDNTEAVQLRSFMEADGLYSDLEVRILNEILSSGATMPEDFKTWTTGVVSDNS